MGLCQKFCSGSFRVRSGLFFVAHPPLGLENFHLKSQICQFFSLRLKKLVGSGYKILRVKGELVSYLLQVKSMLGLGQGPGRLLEIHIFKSINFSYLFITKVYLFSFTENLILLTMGNLSICPNLLI